MDVTCPEGRDTAKYSSRCGEHACAHPLCRWLGFGPKLFKIIRGTDRRFIVPPRWCLEYTNVTVCGIPHFATSAHETTCSRRPTMASISSSALHSPRALPDNPAFISS